MAKAAGTDSGMLERMERVFNPRVVAVVGDKQFNNYLWLNAMKTFKGKLYSVQIDPNEIPGIEALGVPNYRSLLDIEEPVDYVLCAVPQAITPRILADCAKKETPGVALFTAGFAETHTEEGIKAQETITRIAREANILLVGPNCMGIYNRELGLRHSAEQPWGDPGNVSFIAQSGTHCINFSLIGALNGIKCSKTVSIGNAAVLDAVDYLEYFAADPQTEVIGMYLEGVQDGQRLLRTLRQTAQKKPVVIWKGGATPGGARAIYSHTGSLATAPAVWKAAMRQSGAIETTDMDETIDAVQALLYCRPGTGKGVGLVAISGGQSVVIGDSFEREGMDVPALTEASYEKLASFYNIVGGSYRNPIDGGTTLGLGFNREITGRLLDILEEDENIDVVAFEVNVGFMVGRLEKDPAGLEALLADLATRRNQSRKPFVTIVTPGHVPQLAAEVRSKLLEKGVASFASFSAAARALRLAIDYWRFRMGAQ